MYEMVVMIWQWFDDIAIIIVKNVVHNISKPEAINLLKNSVLEDREYIYIKKSSEISVYSRQFFLLSLFSIYKIVDSIEMKNIKNWST